MAFKYIPKGDNDETTCFGITFPKGQAVKVENEKVSAKLRNNGEFQEVDGRTKAAKKNDKS